MKEQILFLPGEKCRYFQCFVRGMEDGITDDNALVAAVAKHDGNNEMTVGLQPAQFAADYAAFLEQAQGKRVFE